MYEGRTDVEKGKVLGHENLGRVAEVGEAVDRIKVGDLVCLPFNISCGFCRNCERGFTGFCLTTNPGNAGARISGTPVWVLTRAAKPNTFAYPMLTLIVCHSLRTPKKRKRTTSCSRISFLLATTLRNWQTSGPENPWLCMVRARSVLRPPIRRRSGERARLWWSIDIRTVCASPKASARQLSMTHGKMQWSEVSVDDQWPGEQTKVVNALATRCTIWRVTKIRMRR